MGRRFIFKQTNSPSSSLLTDLIAYYKFSNNVDDSYTNSLDGTASNVTYGTGVDGECAIFTTASSSNVNFGTSSLLSFTDDTNDFPFSFSGFFKNTNVNGHILGKSSNNSSTNQEYEIQIFDGVFYFRMFSGFTGGQFIGFYIANPFTGSTFKHFAITYDGSKTNAGIKFYVDGVVQTTTLWGLSSYGGMKISTLPLYMGRVSANFSYVTMTIDEFAVYGKELTSTEVNLLMTNYYPF